MVYISQYEQVKKDINNWRDVKKYYQSFSEKDEYVDKFQNTWSKTNQKCGIEVWEKLKN